MNLDQPTYITAIKALVGGDIGGYNNGPMKKIKFLNGKKQQSKKKIQQKIQEIKHI